MKQWIKEPFLHFIILGAVIFLIFNLVNSSQNYNNKIIIDDDKLKHINAIWETQWKRPATSEELKLLVEDYIRQEVLYREALKMNLDQNDEVVKRRLSQKMEFITGDLTKIVEPVTEENLRTYFNLHKNKYLNPAKYSFTQILISNQQHDKPYQYATKLITSNDVKNYNSLKTKGDQTMLPLVFENASKTVILRELGEEFYDALQALPTNQWTGPVISGFGNHLVYITSKTPTYLPKLEEVKEKVIRDYEYEKEITTKQAVYDRMKKDYQITIASEILNSKQKKSLLAYLNKK